MKKILDSCSFDKNTDCNLLATMNAHTKLPSESFLHTCIMIINTSLPIKGGLVKGRVRKIDGTSKEIRLFTHAVL